ncbi:MAG: hypothetical protein P8J32_09190 [bacterium]|nr:hypothetical protein [bacterium]
MKKLILLCLLASTVAFTGCSPSSEKDMCEYEGYEVIDFITRDSDCNCGKSYFLHLRNGNKFQEVRVDPAVYRYYFKSKPKEGYYKIQCIEEVELKEG